jgi:hypothetical protein
MAIGQTFHYGSSPTAHLMEPQLLESLLHVCVIQATWAHLTSQAFLTQGPCPPSSKWLLVWASTAQSPAFPRRHWDLPHQEVSVPSSPAPPFFSWFPLDPVPCLLTLSDFLWARLHNYLSAGDSNITSCPPSLLLPASDTSCQPNTSTGRPPKDAEPIILDMLKQIYISWKPKPKRNTTSHSLK